MNTTAKLKALEALYATLPRFTCQKLCQHCCNHIAMTSLEKAQIDRQIGDLRARRARAITYAQGQPILPGTAWEVIRPAPNNALARQCPLLKDGLCSIHSIRPAICRLYGIVENMPCPHGCKPERVMSVREAWEFLKKVAELSLS